MALLDSLLSAIVRADGDALVMHVGERPYVVAGTQTINISTHDLNLEAMTAMLAQVLPAESQTQLEEFGAVEYRIPQEGDDRFSVVGARGGDDIWIEIRRRRPQPVVAVAPAEDEPVAQAAPEIAAPPQPVEVEAAAPAVAAEAIPEPIATPIPEPVPEPVAEAAPELIAEVAPQPIAEVAPEPIAEVAPQPMAEVAPEPIAEAVSQPMAEVAAEPIAEVAPQPMAEVASEPLAEVVAEPIAEAAPQPMAEVAPEPITEVAPQPMAEVAPAPIAYPTPEPVAETAPEPAVFVQDVPAIASSTHDADAVAPVEHAPEPAPMIAASEPIEAAEQPIAAFVEEPMVAAIEEPAVQTSEETVAMAETIEPPFEPPPMEAASEPPPASEPAVVLPLMRTVRIEVTPRSAPVPVPTPAPAAATAIDRLFRIASARGASALFLTSDSRPWIRVEGDLRFLDSEGPLSRADVESAILEIAPDGGHESIGRGEPTEWVAEFADIGRVRCSTFVDHRGPGVLLRMIATRAASAEQLGLSRDIQALATEQQGIVLVAGPRASGKSTLISALVDVVNRQRADYVITLERQVRLLHDNKSALVSQRQVDGGADDAVIAARAALRENPDVLVVDDLMSPHMVPLILRAASDGLLIFVSITSPSTSDAVQRFVELAPPEMRKALQSSMAEHFRGAVAQVLLKKAGGGVVAAREVLLGTALVTRVISEGQLSQLPIAIDEGRAHGMVSFTHTLVDYVRTGAVDVREAFRKSPDRDRLLESLKRGGIDISAVERLA